MNPRELLYLFFGNESDEALHHPFLRAMNDTGQDELETKRMLLRPPLRTYGRILWEAGLEIHNHSDDWRIGHTGAQDDGTGHCMNRLYNDYDGPNRHFVRADYLGQNKCNVFVSDIAVRSGFRAIVSRQQDNTTLHYSAAGAYANAVHGAPLTTDDRVPLRGQVNGQEATVWGWKIEQWMRSFDNDTDLTTALNRAITEEGRCFIVAGYRPDNPPGKHHSGHIVFVAGVDDAPELAQTPGQGCRHVYIHTREAMTNNGAGSRPIGNAATTDFHLGGAYGNAAAAGGFSRLHLFELHPGFDPDTRQGLADLNVWI